MYPPGKRRERGASRVRARSRVGRRCRLTLRRSSEMADDPQMALVNRLFEASLGTGEVFTVYLGDHLGFYRALLDGPMTAAELADAAETDERATREWLEQQAAAGILSVDDVSAAADQRRFSLPDANADALTDPDSPNSI